MLKKEIGCDHSGANPDDKFCYKCGTGLRLSDPRCKYCDTYVAGHHNFCRGCGRTQKEVLSCSDCGTKMIKPEGWEKSACPKCNFDLAGGGA